MSLENCQQEIINLYSELKKDQTCYERFAFPFLSARPESYEPDQIPSVLFIGKATKHGWEEREWHSRHERLNETQDFLEKIKLQKDGSTFWSFAKKLSAKLGEATGVKIDFFQNLIWTNIAKLGVVDGNPEGWYFNVQKKIAIETLRAELTEYRPSLIVFVTADYQKDVLLNLTAPESEWHRMDDRQYWWLDSREGKPPVLWTEHPQGRSRTLWDSWSEKAAELIVSRRA